MRLPFWVVTTTFETRGLFLKVRVSVLLPLLSVVVVISELSGPVVVVVLVAVSLALEFAFAFDSFDELQAAAAKASAVIAIPIQIFLLTSSLLQKVLERTILAGKRNASQTKPSIDPQTNFMRSFYEIVQLGTRTPYEGVSHMVSVSTESKRLIGNNSVSIRSSEINWLGRHLD